SLFKHDCRESVGERPGTEPPQTTEYAVRPIETSAGPSAGIAEKTAEEVGERTGAAYADGTAEQARGLAGSCPTCRKSEVARRHTIPSIGPTNFCDARRGLCPRLCRGIADPPRQPLAILKT